mmetsp:Transcript_20447/g.42013  ORF Transcript_20447/g.42013 Transcript_20447/m.42013 type:complete len:203 (+) Transcript_20447:288-896(+)
MGRRPVRPDGGTPAGLLVQDDTGPQEVRRGPRGDPHRRRAGGARGEGGAPPAPEVPGHGRLQQRLQPDRHRGQDGGLRGAHRQLLQRPETGIRRVEEGHRGADRAGRRRLTIDRVRCGASRARLRQRSERTRRESIVRPSATDGSLTDRFARPGGSTATTEIGGSRRPIPNGKNPSPDPEEARMGGRNPPIVGTVCAARVCV